MDKLRMLGAQAPTAEAAAQAIYDHLRGLSAAQGQDPSWEVAIKGPDSGERAWRVIWESGPSHWAVAQFIIGPWGFCETDYGCELIFNEEEM